MMSGPLLEDAKVRGLTSSGLESSGGIISHLSGSCYYLPPGIEAPVCGLSLWPGLPHSMVVSGSMNALYGGSVLHEQLFQKTK